MNVQNDIFSNKSYLKQVNKNYDYLIDLVHSNYTPLALSSDESVEIKDILLEFLQEFNGLNHNQQIQFLSNIPNPYQLWKFLSLNPTDYICQTFLEELYQLTFNSLLIKQYLSFHLEDFLLILGVSFDDNLRFNCLKILSLLINDSQLSFKYLNRICYECLYDFDIYYEKIQSLTIESRIIFI